MNKLQIIVVGAGHLGTIHAKLLKQNPLCNVVGVVDPLPSCRQRIQSELGLPTFASLDQIRSPYQAAVVATPTAQHYGVAIRLLEQGKHVLIEKPITVSVLEADHLIQTAEQRNRTLQVGHNERFNAAYTTARQIQPAAKYLEAARTSAFTFRSTDVGVVLDLMIHDLDLVLASVNRRVQQVDAVGTAVFGPHEDMAQARLTFEDGSVANLTASRCSFERQRWIRWFSADGFVSADLDAQCVKSIAVPQWIRDQQTDIRQFAPQKQAAIRDNLFNDSLPLQTRQVDPVNAIDLEHKDFLNCIAQGGQPQVDGWAGRNALAVAELILDSIQQHAWQEPLKRQAA